MGTFTREICESDAYVTSQRKLQILPSVSVFQSMLDKLVAKSVMPVGNCIVWNMESSLMDKCPVIKLLEVVTTHSIPSSVRLVQENMCPEQSSWTWNHQLLTRCVLGHTVNFSTLNN